MKKLIKLYSILKNSILQLFFNQKSFLKSLSPLISDDELKNTNFNKKLNYHEVVDNAIFIERLDIIKSLENKGFILHHHYNQWIENTIVYQCEEIAQYLINKENFMLKEHELHNNLISAIIYCPPIFFLLIKWSQNFYSNLSYEKEIDILIDNYYYKTEELDQYYYQEMMKVIISVQPKLSKNQVVYAVLNMGDVSLMSNTLSKYNEINTIKFDELMLEVVKKISSFNINNNLLPTEIELNKMYLLLLDCYKNYMKIPLDDLENSYHSERIMRCVVMLALKNQKELFWKTLNTQEEKNRDYLLREALRYSCSQAVSEMALDLLSQISFNQSEKLKTLKITLRDIDIKNNETEEKTIICEILIKDLMEIKSIGIEKEIKNAIEQCTDQQLKSNISHYYEKCLLHHQFNEKIEKKENIYVTQPKI